MSIDATAWAQEWAAELGLPTPSPAQVDELLALAGVAAHASERQAAPISTWLAACAGLEPAAALARARELADRLQDAES